MKFGLFNPKKEADYYKLSFYDGFATPQNAEILGNMLFEKFYSIQKLCRSISKNVQPFGRYLLASLIVTKFDGNGEIISQLNYFELAPNIEPLEVKQADDDVNYLSELLYSKPA